MDDAYAAVYPELFQRHWWWRARQAILIEKLRRLVSPMGGEIRILDVGCGAGLFFDALQQFGHVEGIESDSTMVSAAGKWRNRIRCTRLDEGYAPSAPFDVILMLDVLEHVIDPDVVLRRATRILSPTGRILITVPAFEMLWTTHDDLNHHLRRYTAAGLRRAIRTSGLEPIEAGYLFQSLVIPKLAVRATEKLLGARPAPPTIPSPRMNRTLERWYPLEYCLAGWLPFGSSVFAIAAVDRH